MTDDDNFLDRLRAEARNLRFEPDDMMTARIAARVRMAEHLGRELDLTTQQKTQVQQIIEKHRAKIDAVMSSVRPQVRQELDATNAEIETILTAEQKTKFAALRMRIESRRRDRRSTPRQSRSPEL